MTAYDLDEALQRLHRAGPEFDGWLSNHGPMAADALLRLGRADLVASWIRSYERRLEPAPATRWAIDPQRWREPLGDPTRLPDWCELLLREVREEPWTQVLQRWWPRLLPGALASATHGLIRTGDAVRALQEAVTGPRLDELALALGYWAGRWQPVPGEGGAAPRTPGPLDLASGLAALDGLPRVPDEGGARTRMAALSAQAGWPTSRHALRAPADPHDVHAALDLVVDAAVTRYASWGHGEPVMLVHAATAPRAAALVLPSLPVDLWRQTFDVAWAVTAAIGSAYRPAGLLPRREEVDDGALEACIRTGDEHAIKFAEVAAESAARGNAAALPSAAAAAALIGS